MRGRRETGLSPPPGGATTNGRSPARQQLRRAVELRGVSRGSLSEEPTRAGPDLATSPLELAVGREAVRRYEAALVRLRPRDREAVLGRIELQWSYDELAETLGVTTATAARAVVTRALCRLVEAMSG